MTCFAVLCRSRLHVIFRPSNSRLKQIALNDTLAKGLNTLFSLRSIASLTSFIVLNLPRRCDQYHKNT